MGDKGRSKELAREVGVPVVPGTPGDDASAEQIEAFAAEHGYPLIIKALAGGGGKGMRVVTTAAELEPALAAARREAEKAFGDGRVLAERYLERPRHIEIQVLADSHGNVIHLGERECSLQRRHQKVIEEAPSPVIDPAMRERMGAAAVELARACDYEGAGTVEFIAPADGEPRLLLPRDEHAAAGRASGHRVGLGRRPGRRAAPGRGRPRALAAPGGAQRPTATRSRPASTPRILPPASCPRRERSGAGASRGSRAYGSTPASTRTAWSAPTTTRCWPR